VTDASATDDASAAPIAFETTFADAMEGFYTVARPAAARAPRLVAFNRALALELGMDAATLDGERGARVFTGQEVLAGARPIAQAYAGHQFGHFTHQLGDGRALLLGEVVARDGRRFDVQLKGSGPTHFSRGGDGLSALGPVLREYLVSEAMHAMGIRTTRALAAATTGEEVYREEPLPGGVFTRVASSHLRIGSFQFFAARGEFERVRQLLDHAIERHDPDLVDAQEREMRFLARVVDRQAELVASWMGVGFVHGVMNTDNTTISGETIDYGPCAFMDRYDPGTVFSSIDRNGRYAYGRQPRLALWNLARLAEALIPLVEGDRDAAVERATKVVEAFAPRYEAAWLAVMRRKLGLSENGADAAADWSLAEDWHTLMHAAEADFTNAFRALCSAVDGDAVPIEAEFAGSDGLGPWMQRYEARLASESRDPAERAAAMRAANPAFVPRNHKVEEALEAAVRRDDFEPFHRMLEVVTNPFVEQAGAREYAEPAPSDAEPYVTFCGT